MNAWAVIQVGTWSWKTFSSQTQPSALGFVLLIHPQGYFWILPPGRTGLVLFSVFLGEQLAERMT